MVSIPEDIMSDILVRLPVKSIGRFRCVSKAWYKLLKGSEFVKMHLELANKMNKFNIMHHNFTEFHTIGYDPSSTTCSDLVSTVNCPLSSDDYRGYVFWGSCNGLVCLTCCDAREINPPSIVVIWNPSTNEYKKLPMSPSEESINRLSPTVRFGLLVHYGFIYDSKMDDFKVVSLGIYNHKYLCEIHVYTLSSNSWIRLEDITYDLHNHYATPEFSRVSANGALHWKAYREPRGKKTEVILSFNAEKEICKEIQMPSMFDGMYCTNLCVLKESLCLLGYVSLLWVELWELKDYGVTDSWTRLFNIDIQKLFGHVSHLTPLRSFDNGEILFGMDRNNAFNVVLYDQEHETTRELEVYDGMKTYSYCLSVYKESLVSPNSGMTQAETEDE
ncbi:F-box protein CPR1-like isoform X1 [Papaver somniferum]|uniref:F-box protein CPR1-like isoform X1 n=1 Tax=Papaver somniferum TaxID=3469 RepID=UPI000E6F7D7B|nr:F-box protein CPR1-like isoform X1 [Papaver somniferum]XP_026440932.1 F-box protein CPR1-like isoform X1 [Papaver somniferum]